MEVIGHFSHEHKLILKDIKKEKERVVCNGCQKEISGPAYSCKEEECEFFLHERCSQLPKEINHHMHRDHPFGLSSAPLIFQRQRWITCNVCHYDCTGFTYTCTVCDFDVCVSCVLQDDLMIEHKSHPPHPLKLISRRAKFFCDACRTTEEEDDSYRCTTCEFWIHKSCAFTPNIIECIAHHHPLRLAYSLPFVNRAFHCKCDVCGEQVYLSYWVYHCAGCRYFAHLKCATNLEQRLGDDPNKNITSEEDLYPNLVKFPVADKSVDFLIPLSMKSISLAGDSEMPTKLEHWSHDHPLVLLYDNDVSTHSNTNNINEESRVCNGCVLPITSFPFYGCKKEEEECNFFLHTTCSTLRSTLQLLPSYPEPNFCLGAPTTNYYTFRCSGCFERCNGFFFSNNQSRITLCLRCASIPTTIKHESHHHPLVFKFISKKDYKCCRGCGKGCWGDCHYGCVTCSDFNIGYCCAMLPRTVRHDWDKHPIYLSYPPFYWHPDEFYCEICEEQVHPKFWLYHCRVCDHSFHTKCLIEPDYPKIKVGRKLKFENHPHALKLVKIQSWFQCNGCDKPQYFEVALECAPCNFHLCRNCTYNILNITDQSIRIAPNRG